MSNITTSIAVRNEIAERGALVQDFNALKARADALKTAVAE